jgi:hypothetical protein
MPNAQLPSDPVAETLASGRGSVPIEHEGGHSPFRSRPTTLAGGLARPAR